MDIAPLRSTAKLRSDNHQDCINEKNQQNLSSKKSLITIDVAPGITASKLKSKNYKKGSSKYIHQ